MRALFSVLASCLLAAAAGAKAAEPTPRFPSQPIRLMVGYAAGGSVDIVARSYGRRLGELLGESVLVDNRGGAGGAIAAQAVARAPANGYTLYFAASPTLTITPAIQKAGFDPVKDFTPIGIVANYANILLVAAESPYRSIDDLVVAAKARPREMTYGSAGNGASNHFSGVMLAEQAGIDIQHIPFKGNAPAMAELMAGRLTLLFDLSSTAKSQLKGGRVRALAVTTRERNPAFPGVPTMVESGYKDFEFSGWLGVLGPAALPQEVLVRLTQVHRQVVADPSFRAEMAASGYDMSAAAFEPIPGRIARESQTFTDLARRINLKLD